MDKAETYRELDRLLADAGVAERRAVELAVALMRQLYCATGRLAAGAMGTEGNPTGRGFSVHEGYYVVMNQGQYRVMTRTLDRNPAAWYESALFYFGQARDLSDLNERGLPTSRDESDLRSALWRCVDAAGMMAALRRRRWEYVRDEQGLEVLP